MTAPFEKKIISSPLVWTFALLGLVDGIVSYTDRRKKFSDISNVRAINNKMNRTAGTFYYESSAFAVSYGAAVSEEMLFRGLMLPVLDYRYGKKKGLIFSSLIFGFLHLSNPDIDKPFYHFSQAALAGFVFGYNVQHNNYKLSQAIAAHFCYNFISMTTTWLLNPKENPLGIKVKFKI